MNALVQRPDRLPDLLRQAFRSATSGTPGPVHLELPGRLGEQAQGEGNFEVMVEKQFTHFPAYRFSTGYQLRSDRRGTGMRGHTG